ncbi:phage minor capsid protein [Streptomyces spectabilis]|uniref:phage minor capsid protein n=1 Tax=Streptomyces spectabilis TaxID=68270 RepID=UPI0033FD535D
MRYTPPPRRRKHKRTPGRDLHDLGSQWSRLRDSNPRSTRYEQAESDPGGYEAGQRQRAIERHIRRYKRREAAALPPRSPARRPGKVRQWQGAMRDHLAAHPDLRRLRHREQVGAGNLPEPRREPSTAQVEAARVWSGDAQTPREMSDDQLAAAEGSRLLDNRARARTEAETGRRDRADQHARLFPAGHLLDDLTTVPQDDLAWAMRYARDADLARITREMDRRNDVPLPAPAASGDDVLDLLADRDALATDGVTPVSLFSGPAHIAYARASDELKAWRAEHGRLTQAEFIEKITGQPQRWAASARKNESDHQNKR